MIEVTTQKQLDAALAKDANAEITLKKGSFDLTVRGPARPVLIVLAGVYLSVTGAGGARPRVDAGENSQVTAWGNSQVTAWGNSQVTAWENSQVTAWENSQVTARGNSQVTARGNSQVTAWGYAFVRVFSAKRVDAAPTCILALHAKSGAASTRLAEKTRTKA